MHCVYMVVVCDYLLAQNSGNNIVAYNNYNSKRHNQEFRNLVVVTIIIVLFIKCQKMFKIHVNHDEEFIFHCVCIIVFL